MTFSKALGMYKKTGQLSQAVGVMAGLFTENPRDYHLFRSMSLFDFSFILKYTLVRSKSKTHVFPLYCLMHMYCGILKIRGDQLSWIAEILLVGGDASLCILLQEIWLYNHNLLIRGGCQFVDERYLQIPRKSSPLEM